MNTDPDVQFLTFATTENESTPESPYSSNIRRMDYDGIANTVTVEFSGHARYRYEGVTWREWIELKAQRNKAGVSVNRILVKGPHPFKRLPEDGQPETPTETATPPAQMELTDGIRPDSPEPKRERRTAEERRKSRRARPADDAAGRDR